MARFVLAVLLAFFLARSGMLCGADAEDSGTRPVGSREMQTLQSYSRNATDDWLKSNLGMGLSDLELVWDPETLSFEQRSSLDREARMASPRSLSPGAASRGSGPPQSGHRQRGLSLSVQQSDDLRRIGKDLRDLPFGMEVKGDLPLLARLTAVETRVWVPFSWRDEWRAQASLPLTWAGTKRKSLWKEMGFAESLKLRSDFSTRLGNNQLEAGLGTDWNPGGLGTWTLDYDYRQKFGQGEREAVHWLKLSKEF